MSLTIRQRKYVNKKNYSRSVEQMALELGVEVSQVIGYLGEGGSGGKKGESQVDRVSSESGDGYVAVVAYLAGFGWREWIRENGWVVVGLFGLVMLAYINVWGNEFVSDDVAGIASNPSIYEWGAVWTTTLGFMRPLYYYLVANTIGLVPGAFRAINIFSHAFFAGVVYWLVMALVNKRTAILAALLVAVHPLAVESVTWISGGAHSQLALFGGGAMICYLLARGKESRRYLAVGWVVFLVALLFSEKAVMIPGLLLLYHLVFDLRRGWWKRWLPFMGLSMVWVVAFGMKLSGRSSYLVSEHYTQVSSGVGQWWTVPVAVAEYLKLALWPVGLTLYHSETSYSVVSFSVMVAVFVGLVSLIGWFYFRSKDKGTGGVTGGGRVAFWLAWLFVALSPTLVPYGLSWMVAERYVYMGLVGVLVVVAMGFDYMVRRKRGAELALAVFGLILVLLLGRTLVRNHDWKNQDNLWIATARTSPSSPNNHNNLGDLYGRRGDYERAVEEFKLAIELKPGYADAYHNLANTYLQMEEFELAEENFKKAMEYNPNLWQSYQNIAGLYYTTGDLVKAEEYLVQAVQMRPDEVNILLGLGRLYWQTNRQMEAEEIWQRAVEVDARAGELVSQLKSQTQPQPE